MITPVGWRKEFPFCRGVSHLPPPPSSPIAPTTRPFITTAFSTWFKLYTSTQRSVKYGSETTHPYYPFWILKRVISWGKNEKKKLLPADSGCVVFYSRDRRRLCLLGLSVSTSWGSGQTTHELVRSGQEYDSDHDRIGQWPEKYIRRTTRCVGYARAGLTRILWCCSVFLPNFYSLERRLFLACIEQKTSIDKEYHHLHPSVIIHITQLNYRTRRHDQLFQNARKKKK